MLIEKIESREVPQLLDESGFFLQLLMERMTFYFLINPIAKFIGIYFSLCFTVG